MSTIWDLRYCEVSLKEVLLFTPNQAYTEITLLHAFLSLSPFVFKNLFLRPDLVMVSLFNFLIHERRPVCSNIQLFYGSMSFNSFIKSCFKLFKLKIVFLRSHFNNTFFDVKHKRFIRKVFPTCGNVCFFIFHRVLSLALTSFYENPPIRLLPPQNFGSFLVCFLSLDQYKKVLTDS